MPTASRSRLRPRRPRRPTGPVIPPQRIETARLSLLPAEEGWLEALIAGSGMFTLITDLKVAEGFCETPGVLRYSHSNLRRAAECDRRWCAPYLYVDRESQTVVGMGGFKGAPLHRSVEIGYSVATTARGKGIATEAAQAIVQYALAQPEVTLVVAHTVDNPGISASVLRKCGFEPIGETIDPNEGMVWRWENRQKLQRAGR